MDLGGAQKYTAFDIFKMHKVISSISLQDLFAVDDNKIQKGTRGHSCNFTTSDV